MDFGKEKHTSLHMFFVFFPIDVYFLDKDKKVVEIKKNFKPFTIYSAKNKARYLVESPANLPANTGDSLDWQ